MTLVDEPVHGLAKGDAVPLGAQFAILEADRFWWNVPVLGGDVGQALAHALGSVPGGVAGDESLAAGRGRSAVGRQVGVG